MDPLITISIPIYNVEKYIERSLRGALNQTYENLEILVIDDKGTDNSIEVVNKVIASNPRGNIVRIIDHGHNQGTGAVRNTSIANAKGEYLFFMDSDDYISEDCISKLYQAISANKADMAVGSFMHFDINSEKRFPHICKDKTYKGADAFMQFYSSPDFYIQTWNKLYKLELLRTNNIHCIPSNTNEDIFFQYQLFKVLTTIVTIADITYWYAIGDNNATTAAMRKGIIQEKRVMQFIGILNEMKSIYKNRGDRNMARYYLEIKATLIRDICRSLNTSNQKKSAMLSLIPVFADIETKDLINSVPLRLRGYLGDNPISTAKKEKILNFPLKVYRKLKRMINCK